MLRHTAFLAVSLGLLISPIEALAQDAWKIIRVQSKTKWPECFCTDRYGKRHEIGDIICLTVDQKSYEAKCIMAQNNPFWRDLNRGCLSSSLPPENTPAMTPRPTQFAALYE